MQILIIAFIVALALTLMIVRSAKQHSHLSHDHDVSGPQKFHATPVPRVGGLGIFLGILSAGAFLFWSQPAIGRLMLLLLGCALPAFVSGIAEDITKNVSPSRRLLFTAISAVIAFFLVDGRVGRVGTEFLDVTTLPVAACILTVFAVAGVTNAVNIIDGFNGLASMCIVLMMSATAYVAFQVGDSAVLSMCLACIGAVLGFFVWNFPAGLIFLGDGGAYFLGFMVAELSLMLLWRNPTVSPLFPLLTCVYPIFETVFSIYRKKVIRGMSPGVPDGVHLHMLVYKRLMRWMVGRRDAKALTQRNSLTSPYLWVLCMSAVIPAVLFWRNTAILGLFIVLFAFGYVFLYWRIVRFKAPKWLVTRSTK